MDHRVDAGHRRHRRRQADGQLGIQYRQIGIQQRRDHALFLVSWGGDDRDRRHFRTGAGGSRHLDQRQARPLCQPDAIDVRQILRRADQQGNQLGGVHRTAAAKADDGICPGLFRRRHRVEHGGFRRIGLNLAIECGGNPGLFKGGQAARPAAGLAQARIGHDQHAGATQFGTQLRQACSRPHFAHHSRRGFKGKVKHRFPQIFSLPGPHRVRCGRRHQPDRKNGCRQTQTAKRTPLRHASRQ